MVLLEDIMGSRNKMPYKKNYDYQYIELYKIFMQGNDFTHLKSFLDTHGGINAADEYGRTALHNCIIDYNSPTKKITFANEYAKKLIDLGTDINKKDKNNYTAVHICINVKNYEILDILLSQQNIDINIEPNLLMFTLDKDITNFPLMIKFIEMGFNPFEKLDSYSFYDILKEYDEGILQNGSGKVDVKPIMDYIVKYTKK